MRAPVLFLSSVHITLIAAVVRVAPAAATAAAAVIPTSRRLPLFLLLLLLLSLPLLFLLAQRFGALGGIPAVHRCH
jgi:hypothetical protein